jgi:hypothetical protein
MIPKEWKMKKNKRKAGAGFCHPQVIKPNGGVFRAADQNILIKFAEANFGSQLLVGLVGAFHWQLLIHY